MTGTTSLHSTWRTIAADSDHPLAGLVDRAVGQGVRLAVEVGRRNRVGALRFRLVLESDDLGRTVLPVVTGLLDLDEEADAAWIEVTGYRARLPLPDGREVDVPEGILLQVLAELARLIPPGGSLIVEVESPALEITARALAAGVPPVATPLGGMLFAVGCGSAFRVRGAAAGGRAGRRRLQGFRPANEVVEHQRGFAMLADLEAFMARSKDLDWQVQSQTRPIAEATITALRDRFAVPDGPLPPR
jgi:hypothetical protein